MSVRVNRHQALGIFSQGRQISENGGGSHADAVGVGDSPKLSRLSDAPLSACSLRLEAFYQTGLSVPVPYLSVGVSPFAGARRRSRTMGGCPVAKCIPRPARLAHRLHHPTTTRPSPS